MLGVWSRYIVDPWSCALDIRNAQREMELGIPVLVRGEGGSVPGKPRCNPKVVGWGACAGSPRFGFDFHAAAWAVASHDTTPNWFTRYAFGYADSAFAWDPRFDTVLGKSLGPMESLAGYAFERQFEFYTVRVNCTTQQGSFVRK